MVHKVSYTVILQLENAIPWGSNHLLRMAMKPKYYAEEVMGQSQSLSENMDWMPRGFANHWHSMDHGSEVANLCKSENSGSGPLYHTKYVVDLKKSS